MKTVNFIPAALRERARVRHTIRHWAIALGIGLLLMFIILPAGRLTLALPGTQPSEQIERATQRIAVAQSERKKLQLELADVAQRIEAAETAAKHPDWSLLLSVLARQRHDDLVLDSVGLTVRRVAPTTPAKSSTKDTRSVQRESQECALKLVGSAANPSVVFEFAQRLELLGVFDQVRISQTKPQAVPGAGRTWFELEAITRELQEGTQ